jgi:lipopolysaccharide assembly outer membrane protein LptD (OstA)
MFRKMITPAIAVILIALAVYVIKVSDKINLLQTFIPEKIAVLKNVHMSGKEGEHSWEIFAKEGWTGRDKNTTTFEFITEAEIDKNNRPLIKDLKARRLKISKNKDIEILKGADEEKGGDRYLNMLIDFNAVSNKKTKRQFSSLTADSVKFNPNTEKATIIGNIRIFKDKLLIKSEKIDLDLNKNVATFESRSSFSKEGSRLFANSAVAFFDEDKIFMSGSIEVIQKNKTAESDAATYNDRSKTIVLSSNVKAVIKKLGNMIKEKNAKKIKGKEAKSALQEKTVITCDNLQLSNDKGDCRAYGRVRVLQKEKEAKSDEAVYQENSENIVLTGNVYMKRKDDWVRANKVIVSVDKETFEAIGKVETIFKVKRGTKR